MGDENAQDEAGGAAGGEGAPGAGEPKGRVREPLPLPGSGPPKLPGNRSGKRKRDTTSRGYATGQGEVGDLLAGKPRPMAVGGEVRSLPAVPVGGEEGPLDRKNFERMTVEEEQWLSELSPDLSRTLQEDWQWVSQNLDNKWFRVQQTPSLRAWSFLKWARRHRNEFFKSIVPRIEKLERDQGGVEAVREEDELERVSKADLESMLADAIKESKVLRLQKGGKVKYPAGLESKR